MNQAKLIFNFNALISAIFFFTVSLSSTTNAQYTTPVVNGIIGSGEYGNHTTGQNYDNFWYLTWDEDNLYIAIQSTELSDAAIIYIDKNPIVPINGGENSDGSIQGQLYNLTNFARLPFRADLVIYVKNDQREFRTANGSNGWNSPTTNFGSYADNGLYIREFSVPWSDFGGKPASFAFFGFIASDAGHVYNIVPFGNNGGSIGQAARFPWYLTVSNTENNTATKPFSQRSYTYVENISINLGTISAFDFTMNSAALTATKSFSTWNITGTLLINSGTIEIQQNSTSTNVNNVVINSGGSLNFVSTLGRGLVVTGNFENNGTFTCFENTVVFNGSATQYLSGTSPVTIDYLRIDNSEGLEINRNITIDNRVSFYNGNIYLGNNNVTLNSGVTFETGYEPNLNKYFVTNGTGVLTRNNVGATSTLFPVGTSSSYLPITISNSGTADNFSVRAKTTSEGVDYSYAKLKVYWDINELAPGGSDVTLTFQWNVGDENPEFVRGSNAAIGRWNGSVWTPTSTTVSGSDPYTAAASGFTTFSEFTVGNTSALPVELTSFNALILGKNVRLSWNTATEIENYGFDVERSTDKESWTKLAFLEGAGNSNSPRDYNYSDATVSSGKYYYRLKQIDYSGSYEYSKILEVDMNKPVKFELTQNFPNPFNPTTTISFSTPNAIPTTLKVYDAAGSQVAELFNSITEEGMKYQLEFNADNLSSGTYFYELRAGEFREVRKMLLMK